MKTLIGIGIGLVVLLSIVAVVFYRNGPCKIDTYINRTYGDEKIVKYVCGLPIRVIRRDSACSSWMRQNTPASPQPAISWIPVLSEKWHWDGTQETTSYEGWNWSLLAAQICGARIIHSEQAAVGVLRILQDTNQTFEAVQRAYQNLFMGAPITVGYFTATNQTAIVRGNPVFAGWFVNQRQWALATCAILTELNHERHDLLGGVFPTSDSKGAGRELLAKWWSVKDREDLLDTLLWIDMGGHRKDFNTMGAYLETLTTNQVAVLRQKAGKDLEMQNKIDIELAYHAKFGKKSLLGWDYSRYVALCGWGYVAGYLSEAEAWEKIMPVAKMLQQTFDSWEDLGNNYLVGRQYWSYQQTTRSGLATQAAYKTLCTSPESPWRRNAWKTPLP